MAVDVTALAYEPFAVPELEHAPYDYFIERVPSDPKLAGHLSRWRMMRRAGWDLHVLLAPDSKTVVALGLRGLVHVTFRHVPAAHTVGLMRTLGATWDIDPDAPAECPCGCRSVK